MLKVSSSTVSLTGSSRIVQDAGNVIVKRYAVVICAPGLDMLGFIAEFLHPGSDIIVAETGRFLDPSIFARKQLTVVENLVQQ